MSVARQRIAAALSAQNRQRIAAEAAARIIADVSARNHQQPSAVLVDGRPGAPLSSVRLDGGRIEVRYALVAGPPPHGCLRHPVSGRSPPQG